MSRKLKMSDLSPQTVARLIEAYRDEVSTEQLCARFNISPRTLSDLLKREGVARRQKSTLYLWPTKDNRRTFRAAKAAAKRSSRRS